MELLFGSALLVGLVGIRFGHLGAEARVYSVLRERYPHIYRHASRSWWRERAHIPARLYTHLPDAELRALVRRLEIFEVLEGTLTAIVVLLIVAELAL